MFHPVHIYTDGCFDDKIRTHSVLGKSCLVSNTQCNWAAVFVRNGKYIDSVYGASPISQARNIDGEVDAVLNALRHALKQGYVNVEIHHDYNGVGHWARGEWAANKEVSQRFMHEYLKLCSEFASITFTHVKGHSGNFWNEFVDDLAGRPRIIPTHPLSFPSLEL